jgi:hypothetical protein
MMCTLVVRVFKVLGLCVRLHIVWARGEYCGRVVNIVGAWWAALK